MKKVLFLFGIFAFFFLLCMDNPYDPSNIKEEDIDFDTDLKIVLPETTSVFRACSVNISIEDSDRQKIKEIIMISPKNIYGDTIKYKPATVLTGVVEYADSGEFEITAVIVLKNDEETKIKKEFNIYSKISFGVDSISGNTEDSILLTVQDMPRNDLKRVWELSSAEKDTLKTLEDSSYVIFNKKYNGTCVLWLEDSLGNKSPSVQFPLNIKERLKVVTSVTGLGSIYPSLDTAVIRGSGVNFKFLPFMGYKISDVTVNGKSVGSVSEYTISNIDTNKSIVANFVSIEQHNINILIKGLGSSSPSGTFSMSEFSDTTINFTSDYNYKLSDVEVNGESKGALSSIMIHFPKEDINVTAFFTMIDSILPVVDIVTPHAGQTINLPMVGYSLSENCDSAYLAFVYTGTGTPDNVGTYSYTIPTDKLTKGNHIITVSAPLVDLSVYDIKMGCIDTANNASKEVVCSDITYDNSLLRIINVAPINTPKTYIYGDTIKIAVNFSKPATIVPNIGGTLELKLKVGDRIKSLFYSDFSNESSVTANYIVDINDYSEGLELYSDTLTISPTGATIKDSLLKSIDSYYAPVSPILENIKINAIQSGIDSIISSTASGLYTVGDNIDIGIKFSEPVTLSAGELTVYLNTGSKTQRTCVFYSTEIQNTDFIQKNYTVQVGDGGNGTKKLTVDSIRATETVKTFSGNAVSLIIPSRVNLNATNDLKIDTEKPIIDVKISDAQGVEESSINLWVTVSDNFNINSYLWDLDNNGSFETSTKSGSINNIWYSVGTHTVRVKAIDTVGLESDIENISVNVSGISPDITVSMPDTTIGVGDSVVLYVNGSDNKPNLTYQWDLYNDGNTIKTTTTGVLGFRYIAEGLTSSQLTPTCKVIDSDGLESSKITVSTIALYHNFMDNGGFEDGLTDWNYYSKVYSNGSLVDSGGGTIEIIETDSYSGSKCCKIIHKDAVKTEIEKYLYPDPNKYYRLIFRVKTNSVNKILYSIWHVDNNDNASSIHVNLTGNASDWTEYEIRNIEIGSSDGRFLLFRIGITHTTDATAEGTFLIDEIRVIEQAGYID